MSNQSFRHKQQNTAKNNTCDEKNNFDYSKAIERLTDRELLVASMLAIRKIDISVIAKRLDLNARTVEFFQKQIFGKLDVKNEFELAILLYRHLLKSVSLGL